MGGPLNPVARWDQDYAACSRLAAGLVDAEHAHRGHCHAGTPATILATSVAFMDQRDLVPYAITVTQLLASLEAVGAPLCASCGTPTWPAQADAITAAHRHARRYGPARTVYRCPAGTGWHHRRREPIPEATPC